MYIKYLAISVYYFVFVDAVFFRDYRFAVHMTLLSIFINHTESRWSGGTDGEVSISYVDEYFVI
ncbi:MAG: hypothetical protein K8R58_02485 [Bacteroidales bacterium]|nr:hypothetical protein [Bacteroidales bacterium]